MDSAQFVQRVEREMQDLGSERAVVNQGDQFAIWFGKEILGFEEGLVAERLHIGGSGDEKVDLGIAEDDIPIRILAQCKFSSGGGRYNKDEIEEVITARKRVLEFSEMGNQRRRDFSFRYRSAEQKPERLLCIGFGTFTPESFDYAIEHGIVIYDLKKIFNEWLTRKDPARLPIPRLVSIPSSTAARIERGKEPH